MKTETQIRARVDSLQELVFLSKKLGIDTKTLESFIDVLKWVLND